MSPYAYKSTDPKVAADLEAGREALHEWDQAVRAFVGTFPDARPVFHTDPFEGQWCGFSIKPNRHPVDELPEGFRYYQATGSYRPDRRAIQRKHPEALKAGEAYNALQKPEGSPLAVLRDHGMPMMSEARERDSRGFRQRYGAGYFLHEETVYVQHETDYFGPRLAVDAEKWVPIRLSEFHLALEAFQQTISS